MSKAKEGFWIWQGLNSQISVLLASLKKYIICCTETRDGKLGFDWVSISSSKTEGLTCIHLSFVLLWLVFSWKSEYENGNQYLANFLK